MTHGDLCSGIGGFALAARAMGWSTRFFAEIDAKCSRVLAANFPGVPNFGDLRRVDWDLVATIARVDLLTAGFPCQPNSHAGKRDGRNDNRWLWPEIARAVRVLRPRILVVENVPGLASVERGAAMGEVLGDLAELLYDVEGHRLSAGDVGSPQERDRIWLVAYADGEWEQQRERNLARRRRWIANGGEELGDADGRQLQRAGVAGVVRPSARAGEGVGSVAGELAPRADGAPMGDADDVGRWQQQQVAQCASARPRDESDRERESVGHACSSRREGRESERAHGLGRSADDGCELGDWSDGVAVTGYDGTVRAIPRSAAQTGPQSPLWPVADGISGRVAQLSAVGNSIVPRCAYEIFCTFA